MPLSYLFGAFRDIILGARRNSAPQRGEQMLNILDILSLPQFRDFRLVTDSSGLYNEITDAKLYEDLNEPGIPEAYRKGVFVILSPSILRFHPENSREILLGLLERQPSALCIKDSHFNALPQEIIERANSLHVPVFFFSDISLDEILYKVKSTLAPYEVNSLNVGRMSRILFEPMTDIQVEYLAREINPLFYKNVQCAFCIPLDTDNLPEATNQLFEQFLHASHQEQGPGKYAYTLLKWPRGVAFLYTSGSPKEDMGQKLRQKLSESGMDLSTVSIGYGNAYSELHHLRQAFREALYAAMEALLSGLPSKEYNAIGLVGFLAPYRNDEWAEVYYNQMMARLAQNERGGDSSLLQTLLAYVRAGGNIARTAEATFQHSNTIRYRLDKLKSVLGIQDAPDAEVQLYLFARLHEMKKLLI